MPASATMGDIVNTKTGACSCILLKNVKQLHAFKPAEKYKSVEIIANINKNVNSNMTTNQIKIIHISELKRAVNKLMENKLKNKAQIISLERNVK